MLATVLTMATALSGCGTDGSAATLSGSRREPAPRVDSVELPNVADGGTPFTFRAQPGGLLLVYFGYTSCPDVCPTTLADIVAARSKIGDDAGRVALAMATIDPERDTDAVLSGYVNGFVPGSVALRTEEADRLQAAADLFGVYYEVSTAEDDSIEVLHTGTLFGVDAEGTLLASWPFGTSSTDLANDLELLLKEADR